MSSYAELDKWILGKGDHSETLLGMTWAQPDQQEDWLTTSDTPYHHSEVAMRVLRHEFDQFLRRMLGKFIVADSVQSRQFH